MGEKRQKWSNIEVDNEMMRFYLKNKKIAHKKCFPQIESNNSATTEYT